jgi:ferric-dicitrate binding protein FerR (iron transport regulator)
MSGQQEEAARRFAALRRGVMSLEERADFETWRRNKTNAAAFVEMENVWSALDGARVHFAELNSMSGPSDQRQGYARFALLAATCVISLSLGVLSHSAHSSFWTTLDWTNR